MAAQQPLYYCNGFPVLNLRNMTPPPPSAWVPGRDAKASAAPWQPPQPDTELSGMYGRHDGSGTHYVRKRWETEEGPAIVEPWRTFELSYGGIAGTAKRLRKDDAYTTVQDEMPFFSRGL